MQRTWRELIAPLWGETSSLWFESSSWEMRLDFMRLAKESARNFPDSLSLIFLHVCIFVASLISISSSRISARNEQPLWCLYSNTTSTINTKLSSSEVSSSSSSFFSTCLKLNWTSSLAHWISVYHSPTSLWAQFYPCFYTFTLNLYLLCPTLQTS